METTAKVENTDRPAYEQAYHHLFVIKEDKVYFWREYLDTGHAADNFKNIAPDLNSKIE